MRLGTATSSLSDGPFTPWRLHWRNVNPQILVSAGEASGDRYAASVVEALARLRPGTGFFGCAGVEMRKAGVETVVDAASLSVVGLVEVLHHIPRIYGEYRKLVAAARERRPAAAILTDSPDFHLPLARRLKRLGIPVFYLVAPQAWAWREGRVKTLRRNVKELHCIFPFEEEFFRQRGVPAYYIGHPLSRLVQASLTREQFFDKYRLPEDRPLITVCPGSRRGEITRHLPDLCGAVQRIAAHRAATFLLAAPSASTGIEYLDGFLRRTGARLVRGDTWNAMAHADLTLAASGTVTVEAALLNAPMVTYYRVTALSWAMGKALVNVPFYSMVNLVAGRQVVPEFIQDGMRPERLAKAAIQLLEDEPARGRMREGLRAVAAALATGHNPIETSARRIAASLEETEAGS